MDTYDKFVLTGDFNIEEHEMDISEFLGKYNAKCLVKEPTCFKSTQNQLVLTYY